MLINIAELDFPGPHSTADYVEWRSDFIIFKLLPLQEQLMICTLFPTKLQHKITIIIIKYFSK